MTLRLCKPGDHAVVCDPDTGDELLVVIAWQHPRSGTQVRLGGGLGPDALVAMDSDTPVLRRERPEQRHAAGGEVADPLAGGAA